jgi:hypothetical protein
MRTIFLTVAIWAGLCASASAVVNVNVFAVPASEGAGRISAFCNGNPCASPSTLTLERGSTIVATSHKDAFGIDRMSASPQAGDKIRLVVGSTQQALLSYTGPPTVTDPCGRVGQITFAGTNPGGNSAFVTAFVGNHQATVSAANGAYTAKAPEPIAASDSYTVSALYAAEGGNGLRSEWTQRACPAPASTPTDETLPSTNPSGNSLTNSPFAAALAPGAKCSIAAFNAASPLFRRQLKSAVTTLRKAKLRAFGKRRGVVLKNLLVCEKGRVTGEVVLVGKRKLRLAKGSKTLSTATPSSVSLRLKPTKAGKRRFASARKLRVRVTARVVDPAGKAASYSKVLTLKR